MKRLKPRLIIGAAAALVVVGLGAVGASLAIQRHEAPPGFALSTSPGSGQVSGLAGEWVVGPGSQVGYRAKEKFINQPAETEAVARTSKVSGRFRVSVEGGTVRISQMSFMVDLASLTSQDRYATYQVYQRDFFVRSMYLQTDSFPTAAFTANAASFQLPVSGPVSVDVGGRLAVHGITRPVTAHVQAQGDGSQAEVAGSMDVDMRDFAIEPPDISFTRAEPTVTIEYDLKMIHA